MNEVQAIVFSSILSAVIALTVVFINRLFENRNLKKMKYDTVKKYSNPIIFASEQLAWRLKEILEFNAAYLLPNAPMNGYFNYKFDSTVYRLNAVLGWIQAAKKEHSYIEGTKNVHHEKIQKSIFEFQRRLADGSHVEDSILGDLGKLFNLNLDDLGDYKRALIGVKLETIVFKYIPDNVKKNVIKLSDEKQIELLQEIMDSICAETTQTKIKREIIEEKRATAINEISREFCWIYRDWQSAIGDIMIKEIKDANRRFDVIGFPEFQLIHIENPWLKKTDDLFSNLDVSVDDRFDSRVQQLKQLYDSTIELIATFKEIIKKQESISESSFNALSSFNQKINNRKVEMPKKNLRIKIRFERPTSSNA